MESANWNSREATDVPVIECDPSVARERLEAAGVAVDGGNTEHELWRASRGGATAVAYEGKVVVQGADPNRLVGLLRAGDGAHRAHVYFDGACRGNPGPGAVGYVVLSGDGVVAEGAETIGRTTNNRAEYEALIRALEVAADHGFDEVHVRGDSQLIVRQVRGEWDTNDPDLREYRVRALELLDRFDDWRIEHVPRSINERADELADGALDEAS